MQQYEFRSRVDRAFQQRIYVMNVEQIDETQFNFEVMGASGATPYIVSIEKYSFIECSCPDHTHSNKLCKHLLFVLIRVLKESMESIYKSYFLKKIFVTTKQTFENCKTFYITKDSFILLDKDDLVSGVPQRPIEDTDCCPICFEDFNVSLKEPIVFCKASCGKSVHKQCFIKWKSRDASSGGSGSCVYCRAKWI